MFLSIIIPCHNEQEVLLRTYQECCRALEKLQIIYEIIIIDDGSKDKTLLICKEICVIDENVRYISFSRNFGKEAAIYAGLKNANGEYVVIMDADMQDPPTMLPVMYEILQKKEYDCVATRRANRAGEPKLRSFLSRLFYRVIKSISKIEIIDGARDYRMMSRRMVDAVLSMTEYNRFSKGLFGWVGFKTKWIEYDNLERIAGKTKWNLWKLCKYAIDGIINFSDIPLSVASYFGIIMTLISFVLLAFLFIRRLIFGDPVAGWASIVCIIIFLGGIQLLCLGIIGQYLARTYMEVKNRPQYVIAESNVEKVRQ